MLPQYWLLVHWSCCRILSIECQYRTWTTHFTFQEVLFFVDRVILYPCRKHICLFNPAVFDTPYTTELRMCLPGNQKWFISYNISGERTKCSLVHQVLLWNPLFRNHPCSCNISNIEFCLADALYFMKGSVGWLCREIVFPLPRFWFICNESFGGCSCRK